MLVRHLELQNLAPRGERLCYKIKKYFRYNKINQEDRICYYTSARLICTRFCMFLYIDSIELRLYYAKKLSLR